MRHITSHVANSSGRLDLHKDVITSAFESATRTAGDLLQTEASEEVMGTPPMYSQVLITDHEVELAKLELHQQPFNQSKWFFGADGITKFFGYTFGYRVCGGYVKSTGM